nr:PREDICTED: heat shock factor protein 3-like isoform X2 [Lepisosteus oculatus]
MVKQNINLQGFVSKLWTLVDNSDTNDTICWSLNGMNFRIIDEQKFTEEILPRYFKHNNLSSFVRQLNMYGFRKLINIEGGLVKSKKQNVLEFHHPCFQQGKADLLEFIKRKVSSVRTEDTKISHEDMYKVLENVQQMKDKQGDMDQKLQNIKRENETLWKEVASLRRKHNQQQKTLAKVIQFILSLVQGNCVVGFQRKRPLMIDLSEAPPAKCSRDFVLKRKENTVPVTQTNNNEFKASSSSGIRIVEVTNKAKQALSDEILAAGTEESTTERDLLSGPVISETSGHDISKSIAMEDPETVGHCSSKNSAPFDVWEEAAPSETKESASNLQDGSLDSIMTEENASVAPPQSKVVINKNDIQDFTDGIDSNFEDLQTLLAGTQFNIKPEFISDVSDWNESTFDAQGSNDTPGSTEANQVLRYTPSKFLSVLDELCSNLEPEEGKKNEVVPYVPDNFLSILDELCNDLHSKKESSENTYSLSGDESLVPVVPQLVNEEPIFQTHEGSSAFPEEVDTNYSLELKTEDATGAIDLSTTLPEDVLSL